MSGVESQYIKYDIVLVNDVSHPSLEQDLSLKIEERDQTMWIFILEL